MKAAMSFLPIKSSSASATAAAFRRHVRHGVGAFMAQLRHLRLLQGL
jgi:hypothetical protein